MPGDTIADDLTLPFVPSDAEDALARSAALRCVGGSAFLGVVVRVDAFVRTEAVVRVDALLAGREEVVGVRGVGGGLVVERVVRTEVTEAGFAAAIVGDEPPILGEVRGDTVAGIAGRLVTLFVVDVLLTDETEAGGRGEAVTCAGGAVLFAGGAADRADAVVRTDVVDAGRLGASLVPALTGAVRFAAIGVVAASVGAFGGARVGAGGDDTLFEAVGGGVREEEVDADALDDALAGVEIVEATDLRTGAI